MGKKVYTPGDYEASSMRSGLATPHPMSGGESMMGSLRTKSMQNLDYAQTLGSILEPRSDSNIEDYFARMRGYIPDNVGELNLDAFQSIGNYNASSVEDLSIAAQSNWTNWWNNLGNEMDKLDALEKRGEALYEDRLAIDLIQDKAKSENRPLNMREQDKIIDHIQNIQKAELKAQEEERDIADSPVSQAFKEKLETLQAGPTTDWISNERLMQLSQDLAGTLNYTAGQIAGTVSAQVLRKGTKFHPLAAAAGEVAAAALETGLVLHFREKETFSELQGAYDEAMANWEKSYLGNNPIRSEQEEEAFFTAKEEAGRKFRRQLPELYRRNMSLSAQDLVMNRLLIGMNKIPGLKTITKNNKFINKIPSIQRKIGGYVATNTIGTYLSEGVGEEGRQHLWQKRFVDGQMGEPELGLGGWIGDISEAWTSDLNTVASSWLNAWDMESDPEIRNLSFDANFKDAVDKGGFAAMVFRSPGLIIQPTRTALSYHSIHKKVSEGFEPYDKIVSALASAEEGKTDASLMEELNKVTGKETSTQKRKWNKITPESVADKGKTQVYSDDDVDMSVSRTRGNKFIATIKPKTGKEDSNTVIEETFNSKKEAVEFLNKSGVEAPWIEAKEAASFTPQQLRQQARMSKRITKSLMNDVLIEAFQRGKVDEVIASLRKQKGISEDQIQRQVSEVEQAFEEYDKMNSFIFSRGQSLWNNRTKGVFNWSKYDQDLHKEVMHHALTKLDIRYDTEEVIAQLNEQREELVALGEDNNKEAISSIDKEIEAIRAQEYRQLQFHTNQINNLARGASRKGELGTLNRKMDRLQKELDALEENKKIKDEEKTEKRNKLQEELRKSSSLYDKVKGYTKKMRTGDYSFYRDITENGLAYRAILENTSTRSVIEAVQRLLHTKAAPSMEVKTALQLVIDNLKSKIAQNDDLIIAQERVNAFNRKMAEGAHERMEPSDTIKFFQDMKAAKQALMEEEQKVVGVRDEIKLLEEAQTYLNEAASFDDFHSFRADSPMPDDHRQANKGIINPGRKSIKSNKRVVVRGMNEARMEYSYSNKTKKGFHLREASKHTLADQLVGMAEVIKLSRNSYNDFFAAEALAESLIKAALKVQEIESNDNYSSENGLDEAINMLKDTLEDVPQLQETFGLLKDIDVLDSTVNSIVKSLNDKRTEIQKNALANEGRNEAAKESLTNALKQGLMQDQSSKIPLEDLLAQLYDSLNMEETDHQETLKIIDEKIQKIIKETPGLKENAIFFKGSTNYSFVFRNTVLPALGINFGEDEDATPNIYLAAFKADFEPGAILEAIKAYPEEAKKLDKGTVPALREMEIIRSLEMFAKLFPSKTAGKFGIKMFQSLVEHSNTGKDIIVPNFQQAIAIAHMISWFEGPNSGFVLSGYAGSGKTTTVMMALENFTKNFGLTKDEIFVSAGSERVQESIKEKTGIEDVSYKDLAQDDKKAAEKLLEGKKLIILDEAAVIDSKELNRIIKLARTKGIKLLMLGDPNQVSKTISFTTSLENAVASNKTVEAFEPLTIVNRTDIIPLREYQNRFLNSSTNLNISNITGQYSADFKGVMAGTPSQARAVFEEIKSQFPDKTIAVITSEVQLENMKKNFGPEADVMTPVQSQGLEFDIVFNYIAIPQEDTEGMGLPALQYNKEMYVAATRAKEMAFHIQPTSGLNEQVDAIPTSDNTEYFEKAKDAYNEFASTLSDILIKNNQTAGAVNVKKEAAKEESQTEEEQKQQEEQEKQKQEKKTEEAEPQQSTQPAQSSPKSTQGEPDTEEYPMDPELITKDTEGNDVPLPEDYEEQAAPDGLSSLNNDEESKAPEGEGIKMSLHQQNKKSLSTPVPEGATVLPNIKYSALKSLVETKKVNLSSNPEILYRLYRHKVGGQYVYDIAANINNLTSEDPTKPSYTEIANFAVITDEAELKKLYPEGSMGYKLNKLVQSQGALAKINAGSKYVDIAKGELVKYSTKGTVSADMPTVVTSGLINKYMNEVKKNILSNRPEGSTVRQIAKIAIATKQPDDYPDSNLQSVVDQVKEEFEGFRGRAGRTIRDTLLRKNPMGGTLLKEGRPYLIIISEVERKDGTKYYDGTYIEMRPRKVRSTDSHIKKLKSYIQTKNDFVERWTKAYPETKGLDTSFLGFIKAVHRAIEEDENRGDNYSLFIGDQENMIREYNSAVWWLQRLAVNNGMLRNEKGEVDTRVTYLDEIQKIADSFDENGQSTYVASHKEESWVKDDGSPRERGLFYPINMPPNIDKYWANKDEMQPGRPANKEKGTPAETDLFESKQVNIVGAQVWGTITEAAPNISTEEQESTGETGTKENTTKPKEGFGTQAPIEDESSDEDLLAFPDDQSDKLQTKVDKEFIQNIAKMYFGRELTEDELTFTTRAAIRKATNGRVSWGYYRDGAIVVAKDQEGSAYKELAKHELFHKVFHELFSLEDRKIAFRKLVADKPALGNLYKLGVKAEEAGNVNNTYYEALEEYLANEFMVYEKSPDTFTGRLKAFFKRIARVIFRFLVPKRQSLTDMFDDIERGVYADSLFTKTRKKVVGVFRGFNELGERLDNNDAMIEDSYKVVKSALHNSFENDFLRPIDFQKMNIPGDMNAVAQNALTILKSKASRIVEMANNTGLSLEELANSDGKNHKQIAQKILVYQALDIIEEKDLFTNFQEEKNYYGEYSNLMKIIGDMLNVEIKFNSKTRKVNITADKSDEAENNKLDNSKKDTKQDKRDKIADEVEESVSGIPQAFDSEFRNFMQRPTTMVKALTAMIRKESSPKTRPELLDPGYVYMILLQSFQDFKTASETFSEFVTRTYNSTDNEAIKSVYGVFKKMVDLQNEERKSKKVFVSQDGTEIFIARNAEGEDIIARGDYMRMSNNRAAVQSYKKGLTQTARDFLLSIINSPNTPQYVKTDEMWAENMISDFHSFKLNDYLKTIRSTMQSSQFKNLHDVFFNAELSKKYDNHIRQTAANTNDPSAGNTRALRQLTKKDISKKAWGLLQQYAKQLEKKNYENLPKALELIAATIGLEADIDMPAKTAETRKLASYVPAFLKDVAETKAEGERNNDSAQSLAKYITKFDVSARPSSALSKKGRRQWQYNNGTFSYYAIQNVDAIRDKFNTPFWNNNPYVAEEDKLFDFITHHETINTVSGRQVDLRSEQFSDYFSRQFGAHLDLIRNGKTMAWFYTISDKPKTQGLRVKALSTSKTSAKSDLLYNIKQAIRQELEIKDGDFASDAMNAAKDGITKDYNEGKKTTPFRFSKMMVKGKEVNVYASDVKKLGIDKVAANIVKYMDARAEALYDEMMRRSFLTNDSFRTTVQDVYKQKEGTYFKEGLEGDAAIKEVVRNFYYNSFIAKYFVNQMAVGSLHNYKSYNDLIKRIAGPFAPGIQAAVENAFDDQGNPTPEQTVKYKWMPDNNFIHTSASDPYNEFELIHGSEITRNDAQEYRSFNTYHALKEAYGSGIHVGLVDKPVYFSVDKNGEALYVKSAVQTLSPLLTKLSRKAYRVSIALGDASLIADSGVKVGAYNRVALSNEDGAVSPMQASLIGLRQQLDPTKDIKASPSVVIPSQITYLILNNTSANAETAYKVYEQLGALMEIRSENFTRNLIEEDGSINVTEVANLIQRLTEDDEINGIIAELVKEYSADGINVAGISNKALELLLGHAFKNISHIKFKGMKANLVSDEIIEVFDTADGVALFDTYNEKDNNKVAINKILSDEDRTKYKTIYEPLIENRPDMEQLFKLMKYLRAKHKQRKAENPKELTRKNLVQYFIEEKDKLAGTILITEQDIDTALAYFDETWVPRDLMFNNEEGYAEVIVPYAYKHLSPKEMINNPELLKGFGFRLPSTDLHSGLAIKIVGFYHEKDNVTNTVIAPKEVVALHGSDFDADSLSILLFEPHAGSTEEVNKGLAYKKGDIIGLKGKNDLEILNKVYRKEQEKEKPDTAKLKKLQRLLQVAYRNNMLKSYLDIYLDPANAEEKATPLSFDPIFTEIKKEAAEIAHREENKKILEEKGLVEFLKDPNIVVFDKLDAIFDRNVRKTNNNPNDVLYDYQFQMDNNDGQAMVGVMANYGKTMYLSVTKNKAGLPTAIAHKFTSKVNVFDASSDKFQDYEMYPGGTKGMRTTMLLDIMVNAATDAVKAQVLNAINANPVTGDAYGVMIRAGIPFSYQTTFMRSRAMREFVQVVNDLKSHRFEKPTAFNGEFQLPDGVYKREEILASMMNFLKDRAGINIPDIVAEEELSEEEWGALTEKQQEKKLEELDELTDQQDIATREAAKTYKNLVPSLEKTSQSAEEMNKELTEEDALEMLAVLKQYKQMSKNFSVMSAAIEAASYINSNPRTLSDVLNNLEAFEKLSKEDETGQKILHITELPHLRAIQSTLMAQSDIIRESFIYQQDTLRKMMNHAMTDMYIYDQFEKEMFGQLFEQFTITQIYPDIPTYKYEGYEGAEAFTQETVAIFKQMKKDFPDNYFLQQVNFTGSGKERLSGVKLEQIQINTKDMDMETLVRLRASVRDLNTKVSPAYKTTKSSGNLIDNLVKYTVLEKGLNFGSTSLLPILKASDLSSIMEKMKDIKTNLAANPRETVQEFLYQYGSITMRQSTTRSMRTLNSAREKGENHLVTGAETPTLFVGAKKTNNPALMVYSVEWIEGEKKVAIYGDIPRSNMRVVTPTYTNIFQDEMVKELGIENFGEAVNTRNITRANPYIEHVTSLPESPKTGVLYGLSKRSDRSDETYHVANKNGKFSKLSATRAKSSALKLLTDNANEIIKKLELERDKAKESKKSNC